MIVNTDHRGRTATGCYAYRPLLEPTDDDFPIDSIYWERTAKAAVNELIDALGENAACDWFDQVIPPASTPNWKDIALKAEEKLHTLIVNQPEEITPCGH